LFNSTVLEVAVGLIFCYGSVALLSSSIYEAIASLFKLRAHSLLDGVKALLNDPKFTGLARDVYNHALVNPRDGGVAPAGTPPAVKPSYIEPKAFAIAVIESVSGVGATFGQLEEKVSKLPDGQIQTLLQGIVARAGSNLEKVQTALADWFDTGMSRVSGGYKRQVQLLTFIIAFVIAGLLNIDTFHLFQTLWRHPELTGPIAAGADATRDAFKNLDSLPIGWTKGALEALSPVTVCGWLITALTALFGAPFWFDLLQRLVNVRGTGTKPGDESAAKRKEGNK
jgi:hypothetical protein